MTDAKLGCCRSPCAAVDVLACGENASPLAIGVGHADTGALTVFCASVGALPCFSLSPKLLPPPSRRVAAMVQSQNMASSDEAGWVAFWKLAEYGMPEGPG